MSIWTESTAAEIETACLNALASLGVPALRGTVYTMVIRAGVNVSGGARIGSTLKNLARAGKVVQTGLWYQVR